MNAFPTPVPLLKLEQVPQGKALNPFIPSPVLTYYKLGLSSHMATTRLINVVFISLKSYRDFPSANAQFAKALSYLNKHAGLLRQFCPDDKSTVLIAAFGPPPLSHSDDPRRSVAFALDTLSALGDINAGVSRGTCYCGVIGNQQRCEYVVVGPAVNLAARLMGESMKTGSPGVIVDDPTFEALQNETSFDFRARERKHIKGFGLTSSYSANFREIDSTTTDREDKGDVHLEGRDDIMKSMSDILETSPSVCVLGARGFGKTAVLNQFPTPEFSKVVSFRPEAYSKKTPWSTARRLMRSFKKHSFSLPPDSLKLLGLLEDVFAKKTFERTTSVRQFIRRASSASPASSELQADPLKEKIDLTTLEGESRQKLIINLLCELINLDPSGSVIFIIDDCHNADAASLKFLDTVSQTCGKAKILYATSKDAPSSVPVVELHPLTSTQILAILARYLKMLEGTHVDARLEAALVAAAGGSPLFASTLSGYLQVNRLLNVERGNNEGSISLNERGLAAEEKLPSAITGHLNQLMDSLSPESSLAVRCATLLNHNFTANELNGLYKRELHLPPPPHSLTELVRAGLLIYESASESYSFANANIPELVYASIPHSQLCSLHSHYLTELEINEAPAAELFSHAVLSERDASARIYGLEAALSQKNAFLLREGEVMSVR